MKRRTLIIIIIVAAVVLIAVGVLLYLYFTGQIFGSAATVGNQFYVDIGTRKMKDFMPTEKIAASVYLDSSGNGFFENPCNVYPNKKNPLGGAAFGGTSASADFTRKAVTLKSGVTDYYIRVNYPNNLMSCAFFLYSVSPNASGEPKFGGSVLKISNPRPGMVVTAIFATNYTIGSGTTPSPPPSLVGTIYGKAVTVKNGQTVAVEGATVQLRNSSKVTKTNSNGEYWIYGLSKGTYTMDIYKPCEYGQKSVTTTTIVNKIVRAPDASLAPDGVPTDQGKIAIYVKDAVTKKPVVGDWVLFRRLNIDKDQYDFKQTDDYGYYSICPAPASYKYGIKAWAPGYVYTDEVEVIPVKGQTKQVELLLRKQ